MEKKELGDSAKFLLEIWLDGYETYEQMVEACEEFIYEQLNSSATSVEVERVED